MAKKSKRERYSYQFKYAAVMVTEHPGILAERLYSNNVHLPHNKQIQSDAAKAAPLIWAMDQRNGLLNDRVDGHEPHCRLPGHFAYGEGIVEVILTGAAVAFCCRKRSSPSSAAHCQRYVVKTL